LIFATMYVPGSRVLPTEVAPDNSKYGSLLKKLPRKDQNWVVSLLKDYMKRGGVVHKDVVKNFVLKEEVEIDEVLKPKDKSVIDAFYNKESLEGRLLSTDGKTLEKLGMGGQTMAVWKNNKIMVTAVSDVKSTDTILNYMKKSIPKLNFDKKSWQEFFEGVELGEGGWSKPSGKFAGWIAIYNRKQLEIKKDEADGIYGAKQLAIKHFKVPKSKQGILAIAPAYEEVELREEFSEKDFDALKKGDTITIEFKSAMSTGKSTFKVTAKNVVGKARVEKATLQNVKKPNSVKFFLYKRGNKVSLAQGDMAASVVKYTVEEVEMDEAKGTAYPPTIENLRMIVKDKQHQKFMFDKGQAIVDTFTASAMIAVYDAMKKPEIKKKFEEMIKSKEGFMKTQAFAMKMIK